MAQKEVATYAIKVDLDCEKCRKKIKKVLCRIPQIEDQLYDEKNNIVVVKVVCCNPDKVKKKICCEGGKVVKGIELLKQPPPSKPKDKATPPPPKTDKPKDDAPKKDDGKPKEALPKPPPKKDPEPPQIVRPVLVPPTCCRECSEGHGGGPCWALYGRPCYGYPYGRPVYDSWGGGSYVGYNQPTSFYGGGTSTCTYYIRDDNPSGCSIM